MVVYWSEVIDGRLIPYVEEFPVGEGQLKKLLDRCAELRNAGKILITSTSIEVEPATGVIDGKLPNGQPYTWYKRRPPD